MTKTLSVVIVTYNSTRLITDCLNSIEKYNDIGDNLEVIIVDNCSNDQNDLFHIVSEKFPSVKLIPSSVNGGYGHGNNIGVNAAQASRVIVMNPDVRLVQPVFSKILNKFDSDASMGLMGVRFVDGSLPLYFKPEFRTLLRMLFGKAIVSLGLFDVREMYFSGSFLVFDKDVFIQAGKFDENLFLYYEEADISNRILAIGKTTVLAKDVWVEHLAHGRAVNHYLMEVGHTSRKYYFEKYHSDVNRFHKNLLTMYKVKYFAARLLRNEHKTTEFKEWVKMCRKFLGKG